MIFLVLLRKGIKMRNNLSIKIEEYCEKHSTPESEILKKLAEETMKSTTHPLMMAGHIEGAFLKFLVRISSAKRVLEIGTFTGYGALAMAEGLPDDGILITCDINTEYTQIAERYWLKSPHGRKIKLIIGPALDTLKTIEGPFDLIFIDADKSNYGNYWDLCIPKVRRGGIIAIDNVFRGGGVLDPETELEHYINSFNKEIKNDSRVEVLMLPIRDGVTMALKKA